MGLIQNEVLEVAETNLGEVRYIVLYVDFIRPQLASLCTENLVLAFS